MDTARDVVLAVTAAVLIALIRVVWSLAGRVSRLEGRLNGRGRDS